MSGSPSKVPSEGHQDPQGFAIPPRLHVFFLFMTQFIVLIAVLGGVVPTLHDRGIATPILAVGTIAFVIVVHLTLGLLAKLVPVRCRQCRSPSSFLGFGWWPFIYRYTCPRCGSQLRIEVGAR
jgi:hypothetical protein